jgi:membrane protein DedA with SNARE-associated domain
VVFFGVMLESAGMPLPGEAILVNEAICATEPVPLLE